VEQIKHAANANAWDASVSNLYQSIDKIITESML